jgi:hypothetical protein
MTGPDYGNPKVEAAWCSARRADVLAFLEREGIAHGRLGLRPSWHATPYVSVWAVESLEQPDCVGWWGIAGDLPTDCISAENVPGPREAVAAFAAKWAELAACMLRGEEHPVHKVGTRETWPRLGPILESRAQLLDRFAREADLWEDGEPE